MAAPLGTLLGSLSVIEVSRACLIPRSACHLFLNTFLFRESGAVATFREHTCSGVSSKWSVVQMN